MTKQIDEFRRLADDLAANRLTRRAFLRRSGELGLSASMMTALISVTGSGLVLAPRPARAQGANSNTLVVSSWGGGFGDAQRAAHFDPFTKETGIEIVLAPQQPEPALLQAQVDSGNVEWDVAEVSLIGAGLLANKGYLEAIDYSKIDQALMADVMPAVVQPNSVGIFFWPFVLGFSTEEFRADAGPQTWADYWDVGRFPGPRGLTEMSFEPPPFEIPFLANGVAPADIYPMDIAKGFELLTGFRDNIAVWTGYQKNASALIAQGEIVMASSAAPTYYTAQREGAPIAWSNRQALLYYDSWVMPKGAPHPENALRFIEFTLRPETQAAMATHYPSGPVNPKAAALVPDELKAIGDPARLQDPVVVNVDWYTKPDESGKTNIDRIYETWAQWIL
jgi:putative spermidine/putrescine transport system substrate-binding protein